MGRPLRVIRRYSPANAERQTLRRRIEAVEGFGVTEEDDDLSTAYQLLAEFGTLDAIQKHVVIKRKRESAG